LKRNFNNKIKLAISSPLILIIFFAIFFRGAVAEIYWYPIAISIILIFFLTFFLGEKKIIPPPYFLGLEKLFIIWLGWIIISGFTSPHRWNTVFALERILVGIIFLYLCLWIFQNRQSRKFLLWSLFFIGLFYSFFGLLSYFTKNSLFLMADNLGLVRGSFVNHNSFAGLMLLCFFLGVGILLSQESEKSLLASEIWAKRAFLIFPLLLITLALGFSLSRSGWLALGFTILLFIIWLSFYQSSKKFRKYLPLVLGLIIISLILLLILEKGAIKKRAQTLTEFFTEPITGLTLTGRAKIWKSSILMIKDHPFVGVGPGCFWLEYPKYRQKGELHGIRHSHNDLLELGAETGIIGLCLTLLLAYQIIRQIRNNYKLLTSRFEKRIFRGVSFGLFAFLLQDQVDFHFHIPGLYYYFLALLSFLLGAKK